MATAGPGVPTSEPVRIDKWLWSARFFKTRSLAAKAVDGGKVRVNGEGAKPSRGLKVGDELAIRVGELEWVVEVSPHPYPPR